jgi:crotonobetainyl-CoA:carnitine CoA-transferase CaiB-like acyl-CoA transferase
VRSGPTCVRQLADWGADVIKVEATGEDGLQGGSRDTADFQNLHRNKRDIAIDLKQPDGVALLKRMVREADVLVENYRPDVKHRLGIDYDTMHGVNPRLVYASISGFGETGPYRDRPGFDQIAQGMGGLMSVTGLPGQGPVRVGIPIADLCAGIFAAQGILLALLERERSGAGQWVQSSLLAAQIFMLDFQAARWLMDHDVPGQAGNNHPSGAPTGVFRTKDGHINIATTGQAIYRRFCDALGAPQLFTDPLYGDNRTRFKNRDRLNAAIEEITRTRSSAEWIEIFNRASVPCGPIYNIEEVFADPQVRHLEMAAPLDHPKRGPTAIVAQPVKLSRTPWRLWGAAPDKGQHTDQVLHALGYDAAAIADLKRRKIVE